MSIKEQLTSLRMKEVNVFFDWGHVKGLLRVTSNGNFEVRVQTRLDLVEAHVEFSHSDIIAIENFDSLAPEIYLTPYEINRT